MDNLFINKTEFEKVAMTYLDQDHTKWVKQIITEFLTQYPMLQNQVVGVNWIKKDIVKGYAIGVLKAINGSIPVIIKDYQLFPMDMILYGNAAIPLTAESINELMSSPSPFKGVSDEQPKSSLSLFGDKQQYSPIDFTGIPNEDPNSITRDAIKVGSFIDKIENIDKHDIEEILKEANDESILHNFKLNNTINILEKLASKNFYSKEEEVESFLRDTEIDRQYNFIDENGNRFIKQANSKVDYTWTTELNNEHLDNIINTPNTPISPIIKTAYTNSTVSQIKIGAYGNFDIDGVETPKFEIIKISECQPLTKYASYEIKDQGTLIVDESNNYLITPQHIKIASTLEHDGYEPALNDFGVFIVNGVATKPFDIVGLQKYASGGMHYEIIGLEGLNKVAYTLTRSSKNSIEPHEILKNAYYVPKSAKFIKLGNKLNVDTHVFQDLEKIATATKDSKLIKIDTVQNFEKISYYIGANIETYESINSNEYLLPTRANFVTSTIEKVAEIEYIFNNDKVLKDYTGLYTLMGNTFNKYASVHPISGLSKNDAIWACVHCGANQYDIEKIAKLDKGDEYTITNKLNVPKSPTSIIKLANNFFEDKTDKIRLLSSKLVKEASVLTDSSTVDAVLSLGLIQKFNILEFLKLIPDYERISGELAKLLLMVRLGLSQIPELPVKTAMESLTAVTYILKQLSSVTQVAATSN